MAATLLSRPQPRQCTLFETYKHLSAETQNFQFFFVCFVLCFFFHLLHDSLLKTQIDSIILNHRASDVFFKFNLILKFRIGVTRLSYTYTSSNKINQHTQLINRTQSKKNKISSPQNKKLSSHKKENISKHEVSRQNKH